MIPIIFDLDGTLADSLPDIAAAANATIAAFGGTALRHDQVRGYVGDGVAALLARALPAAGISPERHAAATADYLARYDGAVSLTTLYPGMRDALAILAAAGHPLGLCTNKPTAPTMTMLEHFGLTERFGSIVCGDTLPRRKPDPAMLRAAMAGLGADRCLFVGDSEVDADTATATGVPFILHLGGILRRRLDDTPHDAAFADWADVPGLVARLA